MLLSYPIPEDLRLYSALELLPSRLHVFSTGPDEGGITGSLAMLDVESGTVKPFTQDIWPVSDGLWEWGRRWWQHDRDLSANAIHLFTTRDDRVVRWDPETESMVPVPGFEPRTP